VKEVDEVVEDEEVIDDDDETLADMMARFAADDAMKRPEMTDEEYAVMKLRNDSRMAIYESMAAEEEEKNDKKDKKDKKQKKQKKEEKEKKEKQAPMEKK
jgi:hypothetical protein